MIKKVSLRSRLTHGRSYGENVANYHRLFIFCFICCSFTQDLLGL